MLCLRVHNPECWAKHTHTGTVIIVVLAGTDPVQLVCWLHVLALRHLLVETAAGKHWLLVLPKATALPLCVDAEL